MHSESFSISEGFSPLTPSNNFFVFIDVCPKYSAMKSSLFANLKLPSSEINYKKVVKDSQLVLDTRNATKGVSNKGNVVLL